MPTTPGLRSLTTGLSPQKRIHSVAIAGTQIQLSLDYWNLNVKFTESHTQQCWAQGNGQKSSSPNSVPFSTCFYLHLPGLKRRPCGSSRGSRAAHFHSSIFCLLPPRTHTSSSSCRNTNSHRLVSPDSTASCTHPSHEELSKWTWHCVQLFPS